MTAMGYIGRACLAFLIMAIIGNTLSDGHMLSNTEGVFILLCLTLFVAFGGEGNDD